MNRIAVGLASLVLLAGCTATATPSPLTSSSANPSPAFSPVVDPNPSPAPASPTLSLAPLPRPTSTAAAVPTPSASPTTASPEPSAAVEITEFPRGLHAGEEASVAARVPTGIPCTLTVFYGLALHNSTIDKQTKLATQTANTAGEVTWRWTVDPPEGSDATGASVECGEGGAAGIDGVAIYVWSSDLTPSTPLPAELQGTWTLRSVEGGSGLDGDTFDIGPCSLRERCGNLLDIDQPACRFPLVFATISEGVYVVEVDDDDRDGCAEVLGTFNLSPRADGTLKLGSVDGFGGILDRVAS